MKEIIEQLKNQLKAWGEYTYHTTYLDGKKYDGMRNCVDRLNKMYFNPRCRILDLGCNMGGMLWPLRLYFNAAYGLDRDVNCYNFCKNLSKVYNVDDKMAFNLFNLKDIGSLDLGEFDVIFFLALTQHLDNWKECIKWIHEHGKILFIEYNGQPAQLSEYMEYTRKLRVGFDYLGEFNGRYLYTVYNPIYVEVNGRIYQTYLLNEASNCDVYYCHARDVVIKVFKNNSYLKEIEWCDILDCTPNIIEFDHRTKIIMQTNAGHFLTYYNVPDDYINQVENIKKELKEKGCRAEDVELHVKNGKIKIVDLGACTTIRPDEGEYKFSELDGRIDWEMEFIRFRHKQYINGQEITVHNNEGI